MRRALQNFRRRHIRGADLRQAVSQQRMVNPAPQIVKHQLRDVELARRLQWRQPFGTDGFGNNRPGHKLDVGGIQNPVVIGLPNAGYGNGSVFQYQFHHFIGGFDVGERFHNRRTPIDFPRRFQPAEINKRRGVKDAVAQNKRIFRAFGTIKGKSRIFVT